MRRSEKVHFATVKVWVWSKIRSTTHCSPSVRTEGNEKWGNMLSSVDLAGRDSGYHRRATPRCHPGPRHTCVTMPTPTGRGRTLSSLTASHHPGPFAGADDRVGETRRELEEKDQRVVVSRGDPDIPVRHTPWDRDGNRVTYNHCGLYGRRAGRKEG